MNRVLLKLLALTLAAVLLPACGGVDRSSPEAAIASARKVVEQGRADQLGQFIYADSKDMRRLYNRFGVFLGNVQKLGDAVQKHFPKEVAQLKAQAAEAAKSGKASSLFSQLSSQMGPGRNRRKPPDPAEAKATRDAFDNAVKDLFADPYAWLRESETRLTTTFLTDDSVALLWDGKPVMAPIGMIMKKDSDGKWYFVLPTNLPGISNVMPRTEQEFQIWGSLIKVFDNAVIDLTKEVDAGRIHSLEDLSRKAGEMALPPAMMVMLAYGELEQAKKREANASKVAAAAPSASAEKKSDSKKDSGARTPPP